jgi:hypothetical protein
MTLSSARTACGDIGLAAPRVEGLAVSIRLPVDQHYPLGGCRAATVFSIGRSA